MKKELVVVVGIYILSVALVCSIWQRPIVLSLCYICISIFMLYRWHRRSDLIFYFIAFFLGPVGEIFAVYFGAFKYSKPFYLIPLWLPFLWGIAALFVKKTFETVKSMR